MEQQRKLESEELSAEQNYLKDYGVRILILSRGRYDSIGNLTCKLFPVWVEVLVPESEKELYAEQIENPILTVPDSVRGLGQLRNWVLDNFHDETIVMVDDDIVFLYRLTGALTQQVNDPEEAVQIILNDAVMAKDLGVHVFGYSQTDIRKYSACEPFGLRGWVGCVIGVIGRKYRFRNDPFKVDVDMCLQNLLADRILWMDNRYYFSQRRDNNVGGNSMFRTKEGFDESVNSLKKKWGKYLSVSWHKGQIRLSLKVERRQNVKI